MKKFESYHPLTTPHLTMDWLNMFSVKQLQKLNPNDSMEQVVFITQKKIQQVMANISLVYGIKHHEKDDFLGEVGLLNYAKDENSMEFFQDILPSNTRLEILDEILNYLIEFAFVELKLSYLYANCPTQDAEVCEILEQHGFAKTIQTNNNVYYRLYQNSSESNGDE